jgi:AcrR family transcriptional regulator
MNPVEQEPDQAATTARRMSAAERKTCILDAARREFARCGYHGASTAKIAARACCSEPMLYKHFAGKQALFAAVLQSVSEAMEAQIDAVLGLPGDPIENWLEHLPETMSNPLYAEMVGLRKLAVTLVDEPAIVSSIEQGTDRLHQRVRAAVLRSQELGHLRRDVEPEYVAWVWLGITLVSSYRHALEDGGFAKMLPHAETFLRSLMDA